MASKLLYEFSVATGKKVDDLSVYGRTITLFKVAQVWGGGGGGSAQAASLPECPIYTESDRWP